MSGPGLITSYLDTLARQVAADAFPGPARVSKVAFPSSIPAR